MERKTNQKTIKLRTALVFCVTFVVAVIFANILIPKGSENKIGQAKWTVIDYEWTFFFPVPKLYVLYRALYFAYYQIMGGRGTSLDELLASYGIDQTLKEQFGRMEENFQAYLGKENVPVRNMQRVMGTKIIPFSAQTKQGREEIWDLIDELTGMAEPEEAPEE